MGTLQTETQKVLEQERTINNAIDYKVKRGTEPPEWVMRGKVEHYNRLLANGESSDVAAKAIGVHKNTIQRYARRVGIKKTDSRYVKIQKQPRAEAKAPAGKHGRQHSYTPEQRRQYAEQAMALYSSGQVKNISEAAEVISAEKGVFLNGTTLNSWCVGFGLIGRRRNRKSAGHTNGVISIDKAVEVFAATFPEKPNSRMKFENALLRAALEAR